MLKSEHLTPDEHAWVNSLRGAALANFFRKYRQSLLEQLDAPVPDYDKARTIQNQVSGIYTLEGNIKALQSK